MNLVLFYEFISFKIYDLCYLYIFKTYFIIYLKHILIANNVIIIDASRYDLRYFIVHNFSIETNFVL